MSDAFCGEIRLFAGNYAPAGWHFCDGTLLAINSNEVLFSLIGTTYGGDGVTTFGLPDLRGRVPIGQGQGMGLSNHLLGNAGGSESVTLTTSHLPPHTHPFNATTNLATSATPDATMTLATFDTTQIITGLYSNATSTNTVSLNPNAITPAGSSLPRDNVMPSLAMNYIICQMGLYPTFN